MGRLLAVTLLLLGCSSTYESRITVQQIEVDGGEADGGVGGSQGIEGGGPDSTPPGDGQSGTCGWCQYRGLPGKACLLDGGACGCRHSVYPESDYPCEPPTSL